VHYILPGTAENNLKTVWLKLSEVYAARQIPDRYSNLKLTMFSAKGGCKLKGRAAELRNFGHALHPVWKMYWNPEKNLHKKIELCLRLSCHMEKILDTYPQDFVLPGVFFLYCFYMSTCLTKY